MKLSPLYLSRRCAFFRKWRWAYLGAGVLAALLLPGLVGNAAKAAAAFVLAVVALHALLRTALQVPANQRPEDALAETILIDADLIGRGTRLHSAAQPVAAAPEMSLRLGSGTLLMGAAMCLTADELTPADQQAIFRAVTKVNIVPERLQQHQAVIQRTREGSVLIMRVRDGASQRCYYMGNAADVIDLCRHIWEGEPRPLGNDDKLRVLDAAHQIAAEDCRVLAYATCEVDKEPIFLGLAGIGEDIDPAAREAIAQLRDMGLTVMLNTPDLDSADEAALHAQLDLPDVYARADIHLASGEGDPRARLVIPCTRGQDLVSPILHLRETYRTIEGRLRRFALMLGAALLPCLMCGWLAFPCAAALLAALFFLDFLPVPGQTDDRPLPGKVALALYALGVLVTMALFRAADAAFPAVLLLTLLTTVGCVQRLCTIRKAQKLHKGRLPLLITLAGLGALAAALAVTGIFVGMEPVLPLIFALLMGAALAGDLCFGK